MALSLLGFILAVTSPTHGMEWETIKAQVGYLTSEATIATFLAAVQSQIIALSYGNNSTHVKVATNILGFAGVLLDVIAAFLALLSSTVLQRHIAITRLRAIVSGLLMSPDILRRLLSKMRKRAAVLSKSDSQDANANVLELGESAELNIALIPKSFAHIGNAACIGDAAGTAMLLGILCFFASVQCLAISTQPRAVWITSATICSFVVILPVLNRVLGFFGIRLPSVFDI
ncbi:hypothetical protein C8R44DRAFT_872187 [Mycena epipterygia]|nr:hypothetical protein C8R44DRAFT_872187 [Mycena epipterygia]